MATAEKIKVVEEMSGAFRSAGSIFVTDYTGLKVKDMTDLRAQLRKAGVQYHVAKNTLMRRAAEETGYGELSSLLKGQIAIAFGPADPVSTAKIFHEFLGRVEKPAVRKFVVEKRAYGGGDLKALASLPPREVLLSQLVSAVEGPIADFVGTLDSILREIVGTVDALADKKGA